MREVILATFLDLKNSQFHLKTVGLGKSGVVGGFDFRKLDLEIKADG